MKYCRKSNKILRGENRLVIYLFPILVQTPFMSNAYLTLLFFIIISSVNAKAQFLSEFYALPLTSSVELKITISAGNTCNGITILRSEDGINYSPVGGIAGVCGSTTEDTFYSFTDESPLPNALNYYRLDLISLGYTSSISIFFVYLGEEDILMYPNPISVSSKVYFKSFPSELFSYRITDTNGKIIKPDEPVYGGSFELQRGNLRSGMYFLVLEKKNGGPIIKRILVK